MPLVDLVGKERAINITNFESLLSVAKAQTEPQRLLFVFLRSVLPKNHTEEEALRFQSGFGGELHPVMCVDKELDELGSFSDLVTESERIDSNWQIVLIACLAGSDGVLPSSDEATLPLKRMAEAVENGEDLSRYIALRRNGEPLDFGG